MKNYAKQYPIRICTCKTILMHNTASPFANGIVPVLKSAFTSAFVSASANF